jgi:hypothetical protein
LFGYERIGVFLTGNGASVAAYGARAGRTVRRVGAASRGGKIPPSPSWPRLIKVDGDYGELYFRASRSEEKGHLLINPMSARVEGTKTIAFENLRAAPVRVRTGSSCRERGRESEGIIKGFEEFREQASRGDARFAAVQAAGATPSTGRSGRERNG